MLSRALADLRARRAASHHADRPPGLLRQGAEGALRPEQRRAGDPRDRRRDSRATRPATSTRCAPTPTRCTRSSWRWRRPGSASSSTRRRPTRSCCRSSPSSTRSAKYVVLTRHPLAVLSSYVESFFDGDYHVALEHNPILQRYVPGAGALRARAPGAARVGEVRGAGEGARDALPPRLRAPRRALRGAAISYGESGEAFKGLGDPTGVARHTRPVTSSVSKWAAEIASNPDTLALVSQVARRARSAPTSTRSATRAPSIVEQLEAAKGAPVPVKAQAPLRYRLERKAAGRAAAEHPPQRARPRAASAPASRSTSCCASSMARSRRRVFVSYRRADSAGHAGRLEVDLTPATGQSHLPRRLRHRAGRRVPEGPRYRAPLRAAPCWR